MNSDIITSTAFSIEKRYLFLTLHILFCRWTEYAFVYDSYMVKKKLPVQIIIIFGNSCTITVHEDQNDDQIALTLEFILLLII